MFPQETLNRLKGLFNLSTEDLLARQHIAAESFDSGRAEGGGSRRRRDATHFFLFLLELGFMAGVELLGMGRSDLKTPQKGTIIIGPKIRNHKSPQTGMSRCGLKWTSLHSQSKKIIR